MKRSVKHHIEKYLGSCHHIEQGCQHMYYCPQCNHKNPRLSVNYDKNAFKCWKCGWSGYSLSKMMYDLDASKSDLYDVKKILGENKKRESLDVDKNSIYNEVYKKIYKKHKKKNTNIFVKNEWVPILEYDSFLKNPALNYLYSRGLNDFEIKYYDIRFDKNTENIIIPSYSSDGSLNYYVERTVGKSGFYMNPKGVPKQSIIFFESLVDFRQPIVITEGVFDAIQIGYNAIPILGTFVSKTLRKYIELFDTPHIIFFFDKDAFSMMINVVEYLIKNGIKCSFVTSDYKDAGETPRSEIRQLLRNTKPIDKIELSKIKLLT